MDRTFVEYSIEFYEFKESSILAAQIKEEEKFAFNTANQSKIINFFFSSNLSSKWFE